MTPRALLRASRSFRPARQTSLPWSLARRRWASGSSGPQTLVGQFYKDFTRPVAKCLLLAMFTYQLAYYAWVKLETDEIKAERTEIESLEEQVKALQAQNGARTKSS